MRVCKLSFTVRNRLVGCWAITDAGTFPPEMGVFAIWSKTLKTRGPHSGTMRGGPFESGTQS
jgi:hypothetical protein